MHYILRLPSSDIGENNKLCFWKYNFCFCVRIVMYKCTVGVQMYNCTAVFSCDVRIMDTQCYCHIKTGGGLAVTQGGILIIKCTLCHDVLTSGTITQWYCCCNVIL